MKFFIIVLGFLFSVTNSFAQTPVGTWQTINDDNNEINYLIVIEF